MTQAEQADAVRYAATVNYLKVAQPRDAQLGSLVRDLARGIPLTMYAALNAADEIEDRIAASWLREVQQRAQYGREPVAAPALDTTIEPGTYTIALADGSWVTFRVRKSHNPKWPADKVDVLTGPDNEISFTNLGQLKGGRVVPWSDAHWLADRADVKRALPALLSLDQAGMATAGEMYSDRTRVYEGDVLVSVRCYRCGRTLSRPDSISRGQGADCASRED